MKKSLTFVGLFLFSFALSSFAGNYKLDQNKIDAMIENATEVTAVQAFNHALEGTANLPAVLDKPKDPVIAFALSTVLGAAGIHRLYLGTNPINVVLYIITGGGCGIIATVDWILLLMVLIDERELDPFIDNPSFIMWKDSF